MKYSVRHFRISEFVCPDCGQVKISGLLVFYLDLLRAALGVPLIITSGFRCEVHNIEVGGARQSRHLLGCAADIRKPINIKYSVFSDTAKRLLFSHDWEFKRYNEQTHIHVGAPRSETARIWDGEKEIEL